MSELVVEALTRGKATFVAGTFFDLGTVGYDQAEYAVSGTARAYEHDGEGLAVVEESPFTTRIVVYRPADPAAFNGSVHVEWLNVSAGLDAAPVWLYTHRELSSGAGAAWVGVSAQQVGIHGGPSALEMAPMALMDLDPERYGGLAHPGDRFSYDLFSAVGAWARTGAGSIFEPLPVERVLAVGESQSAFRLTTFVNDLDPLEPTFDGYLVHARGGTGAPLHDDVDPRRLREGDPVPFRDDLRVPVLCVQSETDLITLGYQAARQPDGEHLVVWEIAGASHADMYTFGAGFADDGLQPVEQLAVGWRPTADLLGQHLDLPVNAGPQHYVMDAAVRALEAWVHDGVRPPASPRLELAPDGMGFQLDELGNARGGIRTPHVDVPTGVHSGVGNSGGPIAFLAGSTVPFAREQLVELYGTRDAFLDRYRAAAASAAAAGFLCPDEIDEIVAIAAANLDL